MSYVVNWDRADGQPGWHRVGELSEATAFVEHLRNVEGLESSRIFALEPVPFEWRPYYRAEVGSPAPATPSFAASVVALPAAAAEPEPSVEPREPTPQPAWGAALPATDPAPEPEVEPEPEPVNGRRGLFGR